MFDEYYMTREEYHRSGQAAIDADLERRCDAAVDRVDLDYVLDLVLENLNEG